MCGQAHVPEASQLATESNPETGREPARPFMFTESLILAQNERWQRGLGMQVERDRRCSNTAP